MWLSLAYAILHMPKYMTFFSLVTMKICVPATTLVLLALGSTCFALRCPSPEWFYRKSTDSCYFVHGSTNLGTVNNPTGTGPISVKQNWEEVVEECKVRGGKLATLSNAEELDWIRAKLAQSMWYWIGLTYENLRWEWYDGVTYTPYTNIPTLNVVTPTGSETENRQRRGSLYFNSTTNSFQFYLETVAPYNRNGYICKGEWSSKPWCRTEEGWTYRNGTCYLYESNQLDYNSAEKTCMIENGYISVPSTVQVDERMRTWLRDVLHVETAWLGISIKPKNASTTVDSIKWADGSDLTELPMNNWVTKNMSGYLSNLTDGYDYCGQLSTRNSAWNADYSQWISSEHAWTLEACYNYHYFVCEAPVNKCPYGWKELGDQCFQFNSRVEDLRTWDAARAECQSQNTELAVISNRQVYDFITATIDYLYPSVDGKDKYWLGLQNKGATYGWVDSSPTDFTMWSTAEEQTPVVGSCVYQEGLRWEVAVGKWNATLCTEKLNFICQSPTSATIQPGDIILPEHTCTSPFVKFHEGCYLVVKEKRNRDDAQKRCQALGSSVLGIVRTFGENVWLQGQVTSDSWLGLQITGTTVPLGSMSQKYTYDYSDGTPAGEGLFTNFADYTYPSQSETHTKYCVVMAGTDSQYNMTTYGTKARHGKWYHLECTQEREFVCYHDGTPLPVDPPHDSYDDPYCGAGWFRNGSVCYRVYYNPVPWQLAKQTCQNTDPSADLLWISTKSEEDFIKDYIEVNQSNSYYGYWIDFYSDSATDNWYWPYRGYAADKWHLPMAVTNWANGEPGIPSDTTSKPRCAYIAGYWYSSLWMTSKCDEPRVYMCKREIFTLQPLTIPPPMPTAMSGQSLGCRSYWHNIDGRCLQLSINRLTWQESRAYCLAQGGDLISVHNDQDLASIDTTGVWIGLNTVTSPSLPRVYSWIDGSPVDYLPWNVQSHNATVNCGVYTGSQGLAMYSCSERKPSLCAAPLTFIDSTVPAAIPIPHATGCQLWGFGFHDRCYYFGEDPTTPYGTRTWNNFDDAQTFCRSKFNAALVTINNLEEQEYLNPLVSRFASEFWIGLREATTTSWGGAFGSWADYSTVTRVNWAFGEPKVKTSDAARCVAMHGSHTEVVLPGDWYVDDCFERKFALCEGPRTTHPSHPTTSAPITTTTQRNGGCPTGWTTRSGSFSEPLPSCYRVYLGSSQGEIKRVTWQDAENFCRRFRNGHLAAVDTQAEQTYIVYTLLNSWDKNDQVWIGLRQNGAQNKWEWSDGKPLTGTNFWHTSQDHGSDQPDCATMEVYLGKWIPQSCQQAWGWVCEISKGTYSENELIENFPVAIAPNRTCGISTAEGDWFYNVGNGECLYFSRKPEPWNSAQTACRAMGSNLVTIGPNSSYDFITLKAQQFAANPTPFWIGLYQTDPLHLTHAWIDGHISLFRAWEDNEPSTAKSEGDDSFQLGGEQCVAHNSWSGRWKDLNCGRNLPFVCHKSNRVPHERPTQVPDVGACAPNWVAYRGSCYFLSGPENKTFHEANTACIKEITMDKGLPRGELVSIHSSLENDFLVAHARRQHFGREGQMNDFWIGLRDYNSDNNLAWTDQSPLNYINFHVDEPKTYYETDCIAFGSDWMRTGVWSTLPCTSKRAYICKAPKNPSAQPAAPPPTRCSTGYTSYGENCFIVQKLDAGQKTWQKAQDKCKSLGDGYGDIATIVDIFENAEMRVLFHEMMGSDIHHSRAWIGMQEHHGSYAWHNTCPVLYTNFENLYAKLQQDSACAQMRPDGKWNATNCDADADYVLCERRFVPCPAVHNAQDDFFCNDDFPHECNRTCYFVAVGRTHHENSSQVNTITTARAACVAKGGFLASIRSEDDQTCLLQYTKQATQPMWIGLYEKKEGSTNVSYSWVWETDEQVHSPSTYVNWASREPYQSEYSRFTCVEMRTTGEWETQQCTDTSYTRETGYICERRKEFRGGSRRTTTLPPSTGSRTTPGGNGPSSAAVAGIVIGVLIALALVSGITYMVITGKTTSVLASVRSAAARVTVSTTSRISSAGFTNTNYEKSNDRVRVADDPEYHGESGSFS